MSLDNQLIVGERIKQVLALRLKRVLRESYLLPPFIRACLNFFKLTFRALGKNYISSTLSIKILERA